MSRASNGINSTCELPGHKVKSYRIEYDHIDGFMLLSPSTLIFMIATENYEMHYQVYIAIQYHDIAQVFRETPQCLVIIDTKGRIYQFSSFNAVRLIKIEADLQLAS
jgi:hypothetical protein